MRRRIPFFLLVLVPLVAVALALDAWLKRLALERDFEAQQQRHQQMAAQVRAVRERLTAIERDRQQLQTAITATRSEAAPVVPQSSARTAAVRQSLAAFEDAMANDPEAQNRHLAERRSRFVDEYREFSEELRLTEAQSARLADNLLKRYERHLDLGMALRKQLPASPDSETVMKLRQQIDHEHHAAQHELLGEQGMRALEMFERTRPARQFVRQVTTSAEVAGVRFGAPQAEALRALVADASPDFQRGGITRTQDVQWDQVFAEAAGFLSGPQLVALKSAAIPIWNRARLEQLARKP